MGTIAGKKVLTGCGEASSFRNDTMHWCYTYLCNTLEETRTSFMKQVCLLCERTSPDGNLYCQETYCPAEMSPTILDYGEWLGDIEIVKPLIILRSSVLYEARHHQKPVLLKVAHPGTENSERIKREAHFLKEIQKGPQNEYLPVLLPPYLDANINDNPYGRAGLRGHLLYFCLYEHFAGESLRDMLTKNPQLWINHVGWIMISLSYAVAFLQHHGRLHCGLSPDSALVRFEPGSGSNTPSVPRILLIDLGVISEPRRLRNNLSIVNNSQQWYLSFVLPAYTAPELIRQEIKRVGYETDVYGLGLIFYELLVGEPVFPFKLRSDAEVHTAILHNRRTPMSRDQDVQRVADIALQASNEQIAVRFSNAASVANQLTAIFGPVPAKKGRRLPKLKTTLMVVGGLVVVALLIILAAILLS
jgi:serine/threonine protein kinase